MNKISKESLDAYYQEADSWAKGRERENAASRRVAWIVAGIAVVVALCEAVALMLLAPLKTVEPYTLLVDRTTGYVQELKPLEKQQIAGDTALTQSFLIQYVIAREGFDRDTLQADYRKVSLWSADTARSDYVNTMQVSDPDSPLVKLPHNTILKVEAKSVSPLGQHAALVRFDIVRQDQGGQALSPQPWVAVMHYRFAGQPMAVSDRYLNPLGFQVLRYRKDPEALPEAQAPVATVPATGATSPAPTANTTVPARQ
jgi:type IV secretion system protein VirB8